MATVPVNKRAFSLVELLVAVTILAILTSLVVINISNVRRSSRDSRRKSDVQTVTTAINQYVLANGTSFIRYNRQGCTIPTVQTGEVRTLPTATGDGCVGANGLSFGKMNLINDDSGGYGPYTARQYQPHSIMESLKLSGVLANGAQDPQAGQNPITSASARDYVLIRACSTGWQNVGARGVLFAVWTSLESQATDIESANQKTFPGGTEAGPTGQTNPYVYDFGAPNSEYDSEAYTTHGYAAGSGLTKTSFNSQCGSSS